MGRFVVIENHDCGQSIFSSDDLKDACRILLYSLSWNNLRVLLIDTKEGKIVGDCSHSAKSEVAASKVWNNQPFPEKSVFNETLEWMIETYPL